jgi:hypothetical protein
MVSGARSASYLGNPHAKADRFLSARVWRREKKGGRGALRPPEGLKSRIVSRSRLRQEGGGGEIVCGAGLSCYRFAQPACSSATARPAKTGTHPTRPPKSRQIPSFLHFMARSQHGGTAVANRERREKPRQRMRTSDLQLQAKGESHGINTAAHRPGVEPGVNGDLRGCRRSCDRLRGCYQSPRLPARVRTRPKGSLRDVLRRNRPRSRVAGKPIALDRGRREEYHNIIQGIQPRATRWSELVIRSCRRYSCIALFSYPWMAPISASMPC